MKVDALEVIGYREDQLRKLFFATQTKPIDTMINRGARRYDLARKVVFNDGGWKGYFPIGGPLNAVAHNIHKSFRKRFFVKDGRIQGITSDTDFAINAKNTLEEVTHQRWHGDLRPGRYLLLRYTEPQWRAFYDLFKVIDDNLLVGTAFVGAYPDGVPLFTFPMVREYSFEEMTLEDHRELYERLAFAPDPAMLEGTWVMTAIANSNHRSDVARLAFDSKPDGRIEGRYLFLRAVEGQMDARLGPDELKLFDLTPLHDEIRALDSNFMIGKWVTKERAPFGPFSVGLLQSERGGGLGFHYTLKRGEQLRLPTPKFLAPVLSRKLGAIGLRFEETMDGRYWAGETERGPAHLSSLKDGTPIRFDVVITIPSVDDFVENGEHRAEVTGTISFGDFEGATNVSCKLEGGSYFNYLIVDPATEEHQMRYHLRFTHAGTGYVLDGVKYMKRDRKRDLNEILEDYTTLYVHVREQASGKVHGSARMKFRTFETPATVHGMLRFGLSFTVTGTDDPVLEAAAIAKFDAMTTRFVLDEYNPLGI